MPYKYQDIWHQRMRAMEKMLRRKHRSEDTITSYNYALSNMWRLLGKPKNPNDVPLKDYQTLEDLLKSTGHKENTIVTYLTTLKTFLKFCDYKYLDEIDIFAKPQMKEDRVFLEEWEIEKIRAVAHAMGPKFELVFSLGIDNSLRRGDICNITLEDAKTFLSTGKSYVMCKGGRRRLVVMHYRTLESLRLYLEERQMLIQKRGLPEQEHLFLSKISGLHVAPETIAEWIEKVSTASGIYFRTHDSRASFVRRHSRHNTKPEIVMMLMGHKSWDMTFNHYYGQDEMEMRDAQNKF